jgi:hypothetical protein
MIDKGAQKNSMNTKKILGKNPNFGTLFFVKSKLFFRNQTDNKILNAIKIKFLPCMDLAEQPPSDFLNLAEL